MNEWIENKLKGSNFTFYISVWKCFAKKTKFNIPPPVNIVLFLKKNFFLRNIEYNISKYVFKSVATNSNIWSISPVQSF